ncbi:uncharacterized protein [Triticum aestivum]|uniref:uncharacterized protein isoform X3 n=1 Tax=Triticum aestivum TaxID=4565 RepID=UPI001D02A269|nr:uncharacterized protein LOC123052795 isoform X3 [Triticum aestivum]
MVPQIQELLKIRRLCQISPTSQILTTLKRPSLNRIPFQFRGLKGPDLAKFLTAVPHYREGKVLWKNSYKQGLHCSYRGGKHGPGHNIMFCFIRGLEDIYVSVVFTLIWACCAVMLFACCYISELGRS